MASKKEQGMHRHETRLARVVVRYWFALAAIFAASGLVAATASAFKFEAEKYPATGIGTNTNTHVFKVEAGEVKCTEVTFRGSLSAASEALRAKAEYKGCTAFGFPATVSMEGCEYEFRVGEEVSADHYKGSDAIVNTTGESCKEKPSKIVTLSCTVTSGPQTGLKTVNYANLNSASWEKTPHPPFAEVESNSVILEATYTESSGCLKPGTHSNGTYSGATLVKIDNEHEEQIGGRIH
jgi:hypothetical protein